jgi:multiple sugar transport system permease protein
MKPQMMFGAVMAITNSFGVGAVISQIFGFPSTGYALYTLVHELEDYGSIRFEMGYASAISVILFIFTFGINRFVMKLLSD